MGCLDNTGLQKVLTKLKALFDKKSDTGHTHTSLEAVTTTGTGIAYKANVPGITELTNGVNFIMIPHLASSGTYATLNVNNLGAKRIVVKVSSSTGNGMPNFPVANFIKKDIPIKMVYSGTNWVIDNISLASTDTLQGTIPITKGGTGATTAAQAKTNLGIIEYSEVTPGGSAGLMSGNDKLKLNFTPYVTQIYTRSLDPDAGISGSITYNIDAQTADYEIIDIAYTDGSRHWTQRINNPTPDMNFSLAGIVCNETIQSGSVYIHNSMYQFTERGITWKSSVSSQLYGTGTHISAEVGNSSLLKIEKVYGWKKDLS
jgi:hypothetical protein